MRRPQIIFLKSRMPGSRGFSLIETMIAVGIMGILSLAIMQILTNQTVGMQNNQRISTRNDLKSTIT